MAATLLQFQDNDLRDVPKTLRSLADSIEAGKLKDALNCAWVVDCGDGEIAVGLAGGTAEPGAVTHFLLALGMRKLESVSR